MVFKNGRFRDLYSWRNLTYNYWPVWTREVGCMLQILPILLVPLGCIVQTCRYLSSGPPDILDVSGETSAAIILCFSFCCFHPFFLFLVHSSLSLFYSSFSFLRFSFVICLSSPLPMLPLSLPVTHLISEVFLSVSVFAFPSLCMSACEYIGISMRSYDSFICFCPLFLTI